MAVDRQFLESPPSHSAIEVISATRQKNGQWFIQVFVTARVKVDDRHYVYVRRATSLQASLPVVDLDSQDGAGR